METKNICVYGDSLVYGMGDSQEGGWVSRLQEKLGYTEFQFWNFGIPGDTSLDLLKRIEEEIENKKPDKAIVFIGTNDSQCYETRDNTLISPTNYKQSLKKILNILKKHTQNQNIIFIGLLRVNELITMNWNFKYFFCNNNLSKYDKIIEDFCKENNLKYIPIANLLNNDDLNDGAHPNSNGYKKIVTKIYNSIFNI